MEELFLIILLDLVDDNTNIYTKSIRKRKATKNENNAEDTPVSHRKLRKLLDENSKISYLQNDDEANDYIGSTIINVLKTAVLSADNVQLLFREFLRYVTLVIMYYDLEGTVSP